MSAPPVPDPAGRLLPDAPPRERILATASRLFYAEGIHAVGMDRIVTEAETTRATLYRHFLGKEQLVQAYIKLADARIRELADAAVATMSPGEALQAMVSGLGDQLCSPGFRGCPFINAAVEYPDPANPVSQAIAEHRNWYRSLLTRLLVDAGASEPDATAGTLMLLRDGAMTGAALGDQVSIRARFDRAAREVLESAGAFPRGRF
ncbi:TetR/AcrR family transcriptional regulator [Streptomyces hokutonensis]|uniref:TetR/AcrR family transcriptional regulator n=1 Tax=Streptomyces hokutonensis TaxID=1306990 RepID=UPI003811CCA9